MFACLGGKAGSASASAARSHGQTATTSARQGSCATATARGRGCCKAGAQRRSAVRTVSPFAGRPTNQIRPHANGCHNYYSATGHARSHVEQPAGRR
jgi:hypothetical protein